MARRIALALAVVVVSLAGAAPARAQETTSLCHYTGDPQQPYVLVTAQGDEIEGHLDHELDVVPAPALGCPTFVPEPDPEPTETPSPLPEGPVAICHLAVGGVYEALEVPVDALEVHADHDQDLVPAPAGGCPDAVEEEPGSGGEGDGGGGQGGDRDRSRDRRDGGVPTAAPVAASAGASAAMPDGLPLTGARPEVVLLLGLGLLACGAGMRLRLSARR